MENNGSSPFRKDLFFLFAASFVVFTFGVFYIYTHHLVKEIAVFTKNFSKEFFLISLVEHWNSETCILLILTSLSLVYVCRRQMCHSQQRTDLKLSVFFILIYALFLFFKNQLFLGMLLLLPLLGIIFSLLAYPLPVADSNRCFDYKVDVENLCALFFIIFATIFLTVIETKYRLGYTLKFLEIISVVLCFSILLMFYCCLLLLFFRFVLNGFSMCKNPVALKAFQILVFFAGFLFCQLFLGTFFDLEIGKFILIEKVHYATFLLNSGLIFFVFTIMTEAYKLKTLNPRLWPFKTHYYLIPLIGMGIMLIFVPDQSEWNMLLSKLRSCIFFFIFLVSIFYFLPEICRKKFRIPLVLALVLFFLPLLPLKEMPYVRFWLYEVLWTPYLFLEPLENCLNPKKFYPVLEKRLMRSMALGTTKVKLSFKGGGQNKMTHLWIMIDALRALNFEAPEIRDKFPNFYRIAKESLYFKNHRTNCNGTFECIYNICTGYFLNQTSYNPRHFIRANVLSVWAQTCKFEEVYLPSADPWFRLVLGNRKKLNYLVAEAAEGIPLGIKEDFYSASQVFPVIVKILKEKQKGNNFIFAFVNDLHAVRTFNAEGKDFGTSQWEIYLNNLSVVDKNLGYLLDFLAKSEIEEKVIIHILSDHGEEFFEHNHNVHGFYLFEENLRVPLFLKIPGKKPRVIKQATYQLDVVPTFLDLNGISIRAPNFGVSLLPLIDDPEYKLSRPLAVLQAAFSSRLALLLDSRWKLFFDFPRRVYYCFDLLNDPLEKDAIFEVKEELINRAKQMLQLEVLSRN
ncbi:sulfatase-like hydrolase/transferase [Candidatus Riflebacteria bacterium]